MPLVEDLCDIIILKWKLTLTREQELKGFQDHKFFSFLNIFTGV